MHRLPPRAAGRGRQASRIWRSLVEEQHGALRPRVAWHSAHGAGGAAAGWLEKGQVGDGGEARGRRAVQQAPAHGRPHRRDEQYGVGRHGDQEADRGALRAHLGQRLQHDQGLGGGLPGTVLRSHDGAVRQPLYEPPAPGANIRQGPRAGGLLQLECRWVQRGGQGPARVPEAVKRGGEAADARRQDALAQHARPDGLPASKPGAAAGLRRAKPEWSDAD